MVAWLSSCTIVVIATLRIAIPQSMNIQNALINTISTTNLYYFIRNDIGINNESQETKESQKLKESQEPNFVESIQKQINDLTLKLNNQRYSWQIHSETLHNKWNQIYSIFNGKTVLFIGDSTMRTTYSYLANCVCINRNDSKFNENYCFDDRFFISTPNNVTGRYDYKISKGLTPMTFQKVYCPLYDATFIWYKLWAKNINIKTNVNINKYYDMNISKILTTNHSIINKRNDAIITLRRLQPFINKTDILIWNQGLHLQTELRKTAPEKELKSKGENIQLLIFYEQYLEIFKDYIWTQLRRSNDSCLFFKSTQSENCGLMYNDRACIFKENRNLSYFHDEGYGNWSDYVNQCSNIKNIPQEICDKYYHGGGYKPLNQRLRNYVFNVMHKKDAYSKVFVADTGYLLNDTDFCHQESIHKLKCAPCKTYYYAKIVNMANC